MGTRNTRGHEKILAIGVEDTWRAIIISLTRELEDSKECDIGTLHMRSRDEI
jgi:hypothetical protein